MSDPQVESGRGGLRGLVVSVVCWAIVGGGLFLTLTQLTRVGETATVVVVGQSATPYLLPLTAPVLVWALLRRRRALALAAAVPLLCLGVLVAPLLRHPDPPLVDAAAPVVRVLHANVHYANAEPVDTADEILDADADVLALSELTPPVADALDALGATSEYPYRVDATVPGPEGIALWSRLPIDVGTVESWGEMPGVDATVQIGDRRLRILVAHPAPPISRAGKERWADALAAINVATRAGDVPTLLVADVNASWWHPVYRRVLSEGLVDAHRVLGAGLSVSWPTNRWPPTFVRLDHALVDGAVQPRDIDDLHLPSTDHEAFVVEVAVGDPTND